jgi:Flp pilus assembly protein TadG
MTPPPTPPASQRDQWGITTVEFTTVVWLFLVLVVGAVQFGLWWHAQHVVLGAAQDAARIVAAEGGTMTAGRTRALDLLAAGLGRDAASATVQVSRDPRLTRAAVTARLQPLVPIGRGIRLHATATSHTEQPPPAPTSP